MKKTLLGLAVVLLAGCQIGSVSDLVEDAQDIVSFTENLEIEKLAEIVFMSPQNEATEIRGKVPLNFLWKDSVFSLQNHQGAQKFLEKNITISPEHNGEWKILGTTGISFEPKNDWNPSTKYELKISRDLVADFSYSFETNRVQITNLNSQNLIHKEPLKIQLNQEVDLREISLKTSVLDTEKNELLYDLWYGKDSDGEIKKDSLEIIPRENWPEYTNFKLFIESGIFSKKGNLPMLENYEQSFTTAPAFSVEGIRLPGYSKNSISVRFNANVSSEKFAEFLEITPKISTEDWAEYTKNWRENKHETRYFYLNPLGGEWSPRENYTIKIRAGLTDIYGRVLDKEAEESFQTILETEFRPIYMPRSHSTFSNDVTIRPSFVYGGNVDSVKFSLDEESREISLDSSLTDKKTWKIDVAEEFPFIRGENGKLNPGKYKLLIEPNYSDRKWNPKYEAIFYVSDFSVELKKLANDKWQVWAQNYPGETPLFDEKEISRDPQNPEAKTPQKEDFDLEIFVGDWKNEWSWKTFENIKNGFKFSIEGDDRLKTVIVSQNGKTAYGSPSFQEGINPWDANIEFGDWRYGEKFAGSIFTDRPLYKPGQKVYFKGFLRETQLFGKNFPLQNIAKNSNQDYKIIVYDPEYNEITNFAGFTENGSFDGEFEIPESAKLGNYNLNFELKAGGLNLSAPFWIQEYRKPNFLISTKFDAERAILEDKITAKISAKYAFGGAIANRPVKYTVSLFGHEPCRWWCWNMSKKDKVITSGEAVLDKNGKLEISINLHDIDLGEINWDLLTINATIKVSDAEESSTEKSLPFFVANRILEIKNAPYFFQAKNPAKISGEVRDLDKKLMADEEVVMKLFKTKWVRSDRKNADGNFYGEWESVNEKIWEKSTDTNKNGQFVFEFKTPSEGGEYFFEFTTEDEKSREILVKKNFWIADSDMPQVKKNETNKILWMFPNKDNYEVGEFAEIFAPNPEFRVTRAHATIERGEVLEELDFDFATNTVKFKTEKWMAPNVFVSILLEGKDEEGNLRVKWGSHKIQVRDSAHELKVSVNPAKSVYKPGEEAEFKITTTVNGQKVPAEVAIAVVDETLLALKSRVKIDLMQSLVGELPLGVSTFHTLANFMSKAEMDEVLAEADMLMAKMDVGFGGGGGKGDDFKPRGDFRDTAEFFAKIQTDKNGEAIVKFKLPDNLTTWNIFAAGATTDNAFGTTENNFQVTLPLLISEIVPNFFQAGDVINVGILIRRDSAKIESEDIKISLNLPPELEALEGIEKIISVEEEARIYFPIKVKSLDYAKKIEFGFDIFAEKSGVRDAIVLKRKVLPPTQILSAADFLRITDTENPAKFSVLPDKNAIKSFFKIKVFASLANYLENLVDVTQKNDYGCAEQRFSRATGMMYQSQLDEFLDKNSATALRGAAKLNIEQIKEDREYIERSFVGNGFGYWDNSDSPSFWVTTQILEHHDLWKKFGVEIDSQKIANSADWLRGEMLKVCDEHNWRCPHDISRENAAYALAKYGKISVNDLAFLDKYTTSLEAKIWWLKTAKLVGNLSPELKKSFANHLEKVKQSFVIRDRYGFWGETGRSFYSQDERLTAITLAMLMDENLMPEQFHKISQYLAESKREFLSGNSAMQILKTLAKYVQTQETESIGAQFSVENLANKEILLKGSLKNLAQIQEYKIEDFGKEKQSIEIQTDKPILVEIELRDNLPAEFVEANSRGFWIEREVFPMEGKSPAKTAVDDLELGRNYLVKLKVVTNSAHRQVLIEDPIPSGTEIVNFDLDNSDKTMSEVIDGEKKCFWGWCQPLFQHKEYRYDRARFFVDYLAEGTHEISYILKTRLPGEFEWLPAQVKEMYYPEIFANTAGKRIEIK